MSARKRTDDELRVMAEEHLNYEIAMLHDTAAALASEAEHDVTIHNALVESFTIHVRVLIDFLWPVKPRADDVIAGDFFDDSSDWDALRLTFPAVLEPARRRAGKEVAHLTYARLDVTPDGKPWPYVEMANAVLSAFHVFARNASASKIGDRLAALRNTP